MPLSHAERPLYEVKANLFKGLAHPFRIRILELLACQSEVSVAELQSETGLEASHLSQHLSVLRRHRLVVSERRASHVYYRLADPRVARLLTAARELLLGMARYAHDTAQAWSLCRLPLSIRDKFGIEAVVEWAVRMKADAVIGQFYNTDNVGLFRENGIIAIAQDFKKRFTTIPNITGPHHLAGRMAAEYFLKKGFRNFAFYGTRGIDFSDERCQGFRETVEQANPDFTFSSLRSGAQNDLWYYDTAQLITWLQSLPKPVAIMACDDNQAYHITEACLQIEGGGNSRIPNDIAILGVDNDETICKLSAPNLSSLSQGVEQGGYDVARLIDRLIRNLARAQDHSAFVGWDWRKAGSGDGTAESSSDEGGASQGVSDPVLPAGSGR